MEVHALPQSSRPSLCHLHRSLPPLKGHKSPQGRSPNRWSRSALPRGRTAAGQKAEERMQYLSRELKVCEGCGGLWVRTGAEAGIYCHHCRPRIADLPQRRQPRPGRPCRAPRGSVAGANAAGGGRVLSIATARPQAVSATPASAGKGGAA